MIEGDPFSQIVDDAAPDSKSYVRRGEYSTELIVSDVVAHGTAVLAVRDDNVLCGPAGSFEDFFGVSTGDVPGPLIGDEYNATTNDDRSEDFV